LAECLSFGSPTTVTVASSAITVSKSFHKVDSPSAPGSTTNLTTINGGQQGDLLVLMAANDAKTISCRDNTGNLRLAGNCNLDSAVDTITMMYDGTVWVELCRSNN
jgi:hypothetical protein